jgi:hypothetical protein
MPADIFVLDGLTIKKGVWSARKAIVLGSVETA